MTASTKKNQSPVRIGRNGLTRTKIPAAIHSAPARRCVISQSPWELDTNRIILPALWQIVPADHEHNADNHGDNRRNRNVLSHANQKSNRHNDHAEHWYQPEAEQTHCS